MMEKKLQSPTMALNAEGATPYFQMDNNYIVPKSHRAMDILSWVKTHAEAQKGLNALVIHAHSVGWAEGGVEIKEGDPFFADWSYGYGIGIGTGITADHTALFEMLSTKGAESGTRQGTIKEIYFTGCGVAQTTKAKGDRPAADGNLFCSAIAKASGAYVYASLDEQWTFLSALEWRPKNSVTFNGIVLRYKPDGSNERVS
jgi:hypothetical protein